MTPIVAYETIFYICLVGAVLCSIVDRRIEKNRENGNDKDDDFWSGLA